MKKYVFGFLVAVSLTACNAIDSVETEGEEDSIKIDTIIKSTVDTIKKADTIK